MDTNLSLSATVDSGSLTHALSEDVRVNRFVKSAGGLVLAVVALVVAAAGIRAQPAEAATGKLSWQQVQVRSSAFPALSVISALACPSTAECFAAGFGRISDRQGVFILRSKRTGSTWRRILLPSGLGLSRGRLDALACPSTSECFAAGSGGIKRHSGPVLLTTADGGGSWQDVTLPSGLGLSRGRLDALACPSTSE